MSKLYHGDCLEVMKNIPDKSIDLTVTSPPYDNLRTYNNSLEWNFEIFQGIADQRYRITKEGGIIVWVVADATINGSETGTSFRQALYFKDIGFNIHDTMVYLKKGVVFPDKTRYYQAFEYMFILSKGKPKTFNPIKDHKNISYGRKNADVYRQKDGSYKKRSRKSKIIPEYSKRLNYWFIQNAKRGIHTREHPATFSYKLANDHIISWSNKKDTVLDCFMGSGTTGVACANLQREFIGIEKEKKYFDIAKQRIEQAESQLHLF
jgi:DNA modification methylase